MGYIVFIKVGRGKNLAKTQSIILPNKNRVAAYIKRSPLIRSNTQIRVKDTVKDKTYTGTKGKFIKNPFTKKFDY